MKSIFRLVAMQAFVFTLSYAALAQPGGPPPSPEEMAKRQTTHLAEELDLDDAQKAKLQEINLAFAQKLEAMREEGRDHREAMREKRETVQKERVAQLKEVLSEEQFKAFEEMKSDRPKRGKRGEHRGRRGRK